MTEPCPPLAELLALADSETDDPRRDHVRTCPRCRSRLSAYGFFSSLDRDDPCPGEEQAVARLTATLHDHIEHDEPVQPVVRQPAEPGRKVSPARSPWWAPRLLVPAFGVAAILVGVFLIVRDDLPGPVGAPAVREEPGPSQESVVVTAPARTLPDGSLELRWSAVTGTDAYRIRILDSGLREIARYDTGTAISLVLRVADQQAWPSRAAFWQVQALSEGDRIADSAPEALPGASGR
jgi:hypothetical protein